MTTTTQRDITPDLEAVLRTLKDRGWTKGRRQNSRGQVCLVGAIDQSVGYSRRREVVQALWDQLPSVVREGYWTSWESERPLMHFNDHQRTSRPVKKIIRAAIKAEREKIFNAEKIIQAQVHPEPKATISSDPPPPISLVTRHYQERPTLIVTALPMVLIDRDAQINDPAVVPAKELVTVS